MGYPGKRFFAERRKLASDEADIDRVHGMLFFWDWHDGIIAAPSPSLLLTICLLSC
jgi:hypothetical protein